MTRSDFDMYLQAKNIFVNYDQVSALRDVSISVEKGEIVALIGANGAGKSSFLRTVTGLKKPQSGEIIFANQPIHHLSPDRILQAGIAMAPEGRRVFAYMSVKDNLLMGAFSRRQKKEIAEDLEQVLQMFPRLKERYRQAAGTMSGGEQQMLVIGRALMSAPKMLLLDEPSLGIAPKLTQDIARTIVRINKERKISVILVEQNSRMALKIAHRAYALTVGVISLSGNCEDLRQDPRVQELYLGGEVNT